VIFEGHFSDLLTFAILSPQLTCDLLATADIFLLRIQTLRVWLGLVRSFRACTRLRDHFVYFITNIYNTKKVSLQCRHECLLIYLHYPAVQQINYSSWWWTCTLHISTVLMCTWCVVNNEFSVCNTVLGLISYLAQSTFAFGVRSLDVLYNYIHHHMLAKSKQNAHKTRRALGGAHIPPTKGRGTCQKLGTFKNSNSLFVRA